MTQAVQPVPLLLKPMDHVASFVGQGFRFKVPDDTFYPTFYVGRKQNLQLSMFTINRGSISSNSWLRFDATTRYIYGFPLAGNEGKFSFLLKASNSEGKTAEDVLRVRVRKNRGKHNHEFVFKTNFKLVNFVSNVFVRFNFVSRVARYVVNDDISSVWIKSFDKKRQQITIVLNTIPFSPCHKNLLKNIHKKFTTSSGGVHPSFEKALSREFPISSVALKLIGPCNQAEKDDNSEFQWGVLKHLMPVLMLMFVVGVPVGISVVVHKRIKKKKAKLRDERKKRIRMVRMENKMDMVYYRYPSVLSVSNNSREEDATDDERSSTSKINIIPNGTTPNGITPNGTTLNGTTPNGTTPNGNVPSSVNLAVSSTGINKQSNKKLNSNTKANTVNSLEAEKQTNCSASRTVYMGKSEMNIPVYFTKPKEEIKNESDRPFAVIAESISSTLKGFGKSMWNLTGQGDEESTNANEDKKVNLEKGVAKGDKENKLVLLASELELPLAIDTKDDPKQLQSISIIPGPAAIGMPQRCQSELRLTDYGQTSQGKLDYDTCNSEKMKGSLMNSASSRLPKRRVSLPQIHIHCERSGKIVEDKGSSYRVQSGSVETGSGLLNLKSVLKRSVTEVSKGTVANQQPPELGEGLAICELTNQIEQMSREAREEFGSRNEFVQGTEEHVMQGEHQIEYLDEGRYDDEEEDLITEDEEAMDYTTWRMRQIKKAEKAAKNEEANGHRGIANTEYTQDVEYLGDSAVSTDSLAYQDYTNPYQYANSSCLSVKSQSTHLTSHSSNLNWSEEENHYKQQPPCSPLYSPTTQSMPSGLDATKYSHSKDHSEVNNRSKLQEDRSIIGKLFSREKPEENRNQPADKAAEEGSIVGFLKTRVGGLLGPSEGSSWFK
jgi:hypothetical protein